MLKHRTVFVLGAGASAPYGYPLGRGLVNQIVRENPSRDSCLHGPAFTKFQQELQQFALYSIDAFLEYRNDYRDIGSRAIADALIRYERDDLLWPDEDKKQTDNWYAYLFNKLVAGVRFEAFNSLPVAFITFNYDRSLTYFLLRGLMSRYGTSEENAWNMLSQIPIIHVHGDLGPLPLQPRADAKSRAYKPDREPHHVVGAAGRIIIVQVADDNSEAFKRARGQLQTADRVYFLGFGYHRENMRRLGFETGTRFGKPNHSQRIVGTAFGISGPNRVILNRTYPNLGLANADWRITDFLDNCQDFLDDVEP